MSMDGEKRSELTRRRFTAVTTTAVALTILGCDEATTPGAPSGASGGVAAAATGTPSTSAHPAGGAATGDVASPAGGIDPPAPLDVSTASTRGESKRANLARGPFTIGPASQYLRAGVYGNYKKTHGVWIVSDGKALVVLSATCTHLRCTTHFDAEDKCFACPCHESRFDTTGEQQEGGKAKRPLERCALSVVTAEGVEVVQVDPTTRFRKELKQWENPASSLKLV